MPIRPEKSEAAPSTDGRTAISVGNAVGVDLLPRDAYGPPDAEPLLKRLCSLGETANAERRTTSLRYPFVG